jgi:hypothetical protein
VAALLAALSVPRFGVVWHDHEDPDEEHDAHQLLRLLASSQAAHALHHPHQHAHGSERVLLAAEDAHAHGHYVDDSLLVLCCLQRPLLHMLWHVFLRTFRRRRCMIRRLALLMVRAPPATLPLVSSHFTPRERALSPVA